MPLVAGFIIYNKESGFIEIKDQMTTLENQAQVKTFKCIIIRKKKDDR